MSSERYFSKDGSSDSDLIVTYTRYPSLFRPLATKDLIRVGAQYDGGYVVPERVIGASRGLLSCGLGDEWSFEEEFCKRAGISVVCIDPTVNAQFWLRRFLACSIRGITTASPHTVRRAFRFVDYRRFFNQHGHIHLRKPIGYATAGALSLSDAIGFGLHKDQIFLKMDIEGWEYRVLDEIVSLGDRFSGMVIEFHDIDLHEQRIATFIKAIEADFVLVHFHPNTQTCVGPEGQALAVEMTFMNRSLLMADEQLITASLPIKGLDSPNFPNDVECPIRFDGT